MKKESILYQQNLLVVKLLWSCLFIAVIFNIFVDIKFLYPILPIPAGIIISILLTGLACKKSLVKTTMLLNIFTIFAYLTAFTLWKPTIYNFSLIWAGLVLCSLYQNGTIIILSGVGTLIYVNYFCLAYPEIFTNTGEYVHVWLSLITVFITVLLFFNSRHTEGLRRKAEINETGALKKLKSSREYLTAFINNMSDATCIASIHGDILRINKAFEHMLGWPERQFIRHSWIIMPNHDILSEFKQQWQKAITGEQITGWETCIKHKNGNLLNVSITMFPFFDENQHIAALVVFARDITEAKRTEEFLRRSDKLNAIGQLSAGIAHEIRNPLTTVMGFIQLLQRKDTKNNEHFQLILSELERINFIANEFLVLAKPHVANFCIKNIVPILQDVVRLLKTRAIINNVEIITAFSSENAKLNCDVNQLKQVFINIIKNSIEAMPQGGRLVITLELDENDAKIRFSDEGCGISEDEIDRLGEPFFTTKTDGNGLGIVVSKKIIDNHRGCFNISSQLNKGTCVEIALPLAN